MALQNTTGLVVSRRFIAGACHKFLANIIYTFYRPSLFCKVATREINDIVPAAQQQRASEDVLK
jgi:hypothetical protein